MPQKANPYRTMWEHVKPAILEKMTALSANLNGVVPYSVSEPYISGPDEEYGSDEYRVSIDLKNEHDIVVLSAEFQLRDGQDDGQEGYAIACELTGYNALALGGYKPDAFQNDFFTLHNDVLDARIEEFDAYEFALSIHNEVLTDPVLLTEVAEATSAITPS